MPGPNVIPGAKGKDYRFVKYGGKIYVVYRVKIAPGKYTNLSYLVEKDQYKALGVKPAAIKSIGRNAFRNLNYFGPASDIAGGNRDEHPFNRFVRELRERNPGASWLKDREFMATMLMGKAENWSAAELDQVLQKTNWYQNRTDAQRQWELYTGKADRNRALKSMAERVRDSLTELYGEGQSWQNDWSTQRINLVARNIASGKWGDPSEGFELWFSNAQDKAAKIEGTAAWIERQQELEAQREYMNRPEDIREQIRQEAFEWLGPKGTPDEEALIRWSKDLAAELKSDGDWQSFLQTQAQSLYPWLGQGERWQDRAGSYKRILEEQWGTSIGWEEGLLFDIGEKNETTGEFTGAATSYDNFKRMARQDDRFWQSDLGKQEGAELFGLLNDTFRGVR